MFNLPYIHAKSLHNQLWRWLAQNPEKSKRDWPGWNEVTTMYGPIKNRCFACQVASEEAERRGVVARLTLPRPGAVLTPWSYIVMCPHCPITVWRDPALRRDIPPTRGSCMHDRSLFRQYLNSELRPRMLDYGQTYLKRRDIAALIARLEWPETFEDYHNLEIKI